MRPVTYVAAADEAAAQAALSEEGAAPIAGGTNLVDLLKLHVQNPQQLVDVNPLPWGGIETLASGGLRLGATARNSAVAHHPAVKADYPVLSEALLSGASPQIRNMATVGGNLLQRTRCAYFRDVSLPCNKREPGSGCGALDGYQRMHAVLGTSEHCLAAHPSDMCVALAALEGVVILRGPQGERRVPIADFHVLPGDHPERENALAPGELVVAVDLPRTAWARRSRYLKVRDRASFSFALASAAVALDLEGNHIRAARVALGGVGTKPWRSLEAEEVLHGHTASELTFKAAAEAALRGARPRAHNGFKVELARRTLVRALALTAGLA